MWYTNPYAYERIEIRKVQQFMEPSKRYNELVEELNYHSKLYYTKDAPVISDYRCV